jgi:hypothetical protein
LDNKASILALRSKAINETALLQSNVRPSGVTKELIEAWLKWQNSLPLNK